jgi:hypothetical protein
VNAAGIGRIADRAGDIGAVRDMPDAGRDRSASAAGRAAWRNGGIARILGIAVNEVGGEPAIGKRRAIGARMTAPDFRKLSITGLFSRAMLSRCKLSPLVLA